MAASLLFSIALTMCGYTSAIAGALTVNSTVTFASLDNSGVDEDATAGILKVSSLTIQSGGSINANDDPPKIPNANADPMTIVVTGDAEIQAGGAIYAENRSQGGSGGNIRLTVGGTLILRGTSGLTPGGIISSSKSGGGGSGNGGDITINATGSITLEAGSAILAESNATSGGAIELTSSGDITIAGEVSSYGNISGVSNQPPGGGQIIITAAGNLLVNDAGIISSKGRDPGADLVSLRACQVTIYGLVESTGPGHVVPSNPANHVGPSNRPGKPANSTAGIEIWAGTTLTIDGLNHNGQINADLGPAGGRSWIDLFANGAINILGSTVSTDNFVVHANEEGANTTTAGIITVKSLNSTITASGRVLQADATTGGSTGGEMTIEAKGAVTLDGATIFARGDFNETGGYGKADTVSVRSFGSTISWTNGTGDVRPTGTDNVGTTLAASSRGVIFFKKCAGTVNVTGATFPNNGTPATTPTTLGDDCSGAPTVPTYVTFPTCGGDQHLPVEFSSFNLASADGFVAISWSTASEINNAGFEIYRAIGEDSIFTAIASYINQPALVGLGTSALGRNYSFVDGNNAPLQAGTVYSYKIVDVSTEGIRTEHGTKSIRVDDAATADVSFLRLHSVMPNPAYDEMQAIYTLPEETTVSMEIYTADGRLVATPLNAVSQTIGSHSQSISVAHLAPGMYTLRLMAGTGSRVQQFVVVR
jgi:hypothetical protein